MAKSFWTPMAMGVVAGTVIGLATAGLTTERERRMLREKAGKTVRDILG
ncbi:MAG: hypothetical protein VB086_04940 [Clostridiaceae bacterium]|nr:hypothetical protein [Clostridiaceae bacterium]